jgi:(p)ppGpp synthase/HD superfamily hydrolase
MAIAALLHDAVEDQGGVARLTDIRNRFGARVADIVNACSDSFANVSAGERKPDWRTRKTRYIQHLEIVDKDVLLVSLADKIHNARSILRDSRTPEIGPRIWERFSKPKNDTLWHYEELARAFQAHLPGVNLPMS